MGEKRKGFNIAATRFIQGASAEVLKAPEPSQSLAKEPAKKSMNVPARFHLPPEIKKAVDVASAKAGVKASAIVAEALRNHPAVKAEL